MKKKYIVIAVVLLVVVAGAVFAYWYFNKPPSGEVVFKRYIQSSVKTNTFAIEQTNTGTGSTQSGYAFNDIPAKKYGVNATSECSAKHSTGEAKINVAIQVENEKTYVKLNSISGSFKTAEGKVYDLSSVYSKIVGKWYTLSQDDPAISSLLNSGVAAYNSIFMAPSYDTVKLANEIINNKVFSYKSYNVDKGLYNFQFVSDRNAYSTFLKNNIPNLSNVDLVMDNIFSDKSSMESTMTFNEDGVWQEEKLSAYNLCVDLYEIYIGEKPANIAKEIPGVSKPKDYQTIKQTPVGDAPDLMKMKDEYVF